MRLTSNITARNSTGEQVWAVTKYGYRSRHNYSGRKGGVRDGKIVLDQTFISLLAIYARARAG
jgi:hypothetical protein